MGNGDVAKNIKGDTGRLRQRGPRLNVHSDCDWQIWTNYLLPSDKEFKERGNASWVLSTRGSRIYPTRSEMKRREGIYILLLSQLVGIAHFPDRELFLE